MSAEQKTWTEKYRPKSLDEVVGNTDIISKLKVFVAEKNVPNLFFSGPPGIGKTSAIQALGCDLYGCGYQKIQEQGLMLESNASTLNRIKDIRESRTGKPAAIKRFMMSAVPEGKPFKILILDEAERLTDSAQHAMRRLIERYHRTCKVCIICNQPERIIDFLRSRCSTFNFRPLKEEEMETCLTRIAISENLEMDDHSLDAVLKTSRGDLRKAINILQIAASHAEGAINSKYIYNIESKIQSEKIREILHLSLKGSFIKSNELLEELLEERFPRTEILKQISIEIPLLDINTKCKVKLLDEVARTDFLLTQSRNIDLQLSSLLAKISQIDRSNGAVSGR